MLTKKPRRSLTQLRTKVPRTVVNVIIYVVLAGLGFVSVYPILYMLITSLKGETDLVSPFVVWIPHELNFYNYYLVILHLRFGSSLKSSLIISLSVAASQAISCAVIGYGFARYKFRGRNILFLLVIFTFIIPPETLTVPLYMLFSKYGWINTYLPFFVPGLLGQGLRGALFVIIYRQFFSTLPWELEDAARIDGLGEFRIFTHIMLPISKTAVAMIFLFSMVWSWNDFYFPSIFLRPANYPLSVRLMGLWTDVRDKMQVIRFPDEKPLHEFEINPYALAISARHEGFGMAAVTLVILVPMGLYLFLQHYFTESVERTGLVE